MRLSVVYCWCSLMQYYFEGFENLWVEFMPVMGNCHFLSAPFHAILFGKKELIPLLQPSGSRGCQSGYLEPTPLCSNSCMREPVSYPLSHRYFPRYEDVAHGPIEVRPWDFLTWSWVKDRWTEEKEKYLILGLLVSTPSTVWRNQLRARAKKGSRDENRREKSQKGPIPRFPGVPTFSDEVLCKPLHLPLSPS